MKLCFSFCLLFLAQIVIASDNLKNEVSLFCSWTAYGDEVDSFIIKKKERTAYWANEEKAIKVTEFNEGLIKLEGVKKKVLIDQTENRTSVYTENVSLRFTINRVTGKLKIDWLSAPTYKYNVTGYSCKLNKVF